MLDSDNEAALDQIADQQTEPGAPRSAELTRSLDLPLVANDPREQLDTVDDDPTIRNDVANPVGVHAGLLQQVQVSPSGAKGSHHFSRGRPVTRPRVVNTIFGRFSKAEK